MTDYLDSRDKLFVSVVAALRSYSDLHAIGESDHTLERIIDSSISIYTEDRQTEFFAGLIRQLRSILCLGNPQMEEATSAFTATLQDGLFVISAGIGRYRKFSKLYMEDMVEEDVRQFIDKAIDSGDAGYLGSWYADSFVDSKNYRHILFMDSCHTIGDWDRNLIELFSAGIQKEHDRLVHDLSLDTSIEGIVYALGQVVEARSRYIGNHVERISEYSRFIAQKVGLSQEKTNLIATAVPIHDIGKLGISEEILNKPGKLTDEEFSEVKKHPGTAGNILKDAKGPLLRMSAEIAMSHHEKYDGSGYPYGLKGEDIPLSGRIVALADVVDALSSDSVYRKAWPFDRVVSLIKEESGKHFDPKVVDGFLNHLDEFVALKISLQDMG